MNCTPGIGSRAPIVSLRRGSTLGPPPAESPLPIRCSLASLLASLLSPPASLAYGPYRIFKPFLACQLCSSRWATFRSHQKLKLAMPHWRMSSHRNTARKTTRGSSSMCATLSSLLLGVLLPLVGWLLVGGSTQRNPSHLPRAGRYVLLKADYSQMEMRILAHVSEDEFLAQFFQEGRDIHKLIAARWLGGFPARERPERERETRERERERERPERETRERPERDQRESNQPYKRRASEEISVPAILRAMN